MEEFKSYLEYNPENGEFKRLKRMGRCAPGSQVGALDKDGYRVIHYKGRAYKAHRLAWFVMKGEFPKKSIDHVDKNPSNNRWCNLREVDHKENARNQKRFSNNKSGVTGVYWSEKRRVWVANICVDKKTIYLGSSKEFEKAVTLRVAAETKYRFHKNHGGKR